MYADRTIDRVARRFAEGAAFQTANPYALFYGVAMNLLKEHWRKSERESKVLENIFSSPDLLEDPESIRAREEERNQQEVRMTCLRHCLGDLPSESITLIKKYYAEGDVLDKEQRKQLAAGLGISVNTLRVRAYRVRGESRTMC